VSLLLRLMLSMTGVESLGRGVAAFLMRGAAARAASWLLDTLRHSLMRADIACMQFYTLRICVIKIDGWVREHLHGPACPPAPPGK
jgi:hypothetical protein